jgi:integrase
MRYVVEKRNRAGSSRWYWQRAGFNTKRLPDDEVERLKAAAALNERADAEKRGETGPTEPEYGTIAWAVAEYRASPTWQKLTVGTRRIYEPYMLSLDKIKGRQPVTVLNRSAVREVLKAIPSKGRKVHCAAVLKRILDIAWDHDLIDRNPAIRLGLAQARTRAAIWSDEDIERFLTHCAGALYGEAVALHIQLMLYTAQRPGDCLKMAWKAYNGRRVEVVQEKTGTLVWIDCPAPLLGILEDARRRATGMAMVVGSDGRRLGESTWRKAFNTIRAEAELGHLQARDLRRTAIVNLAEAGCTTPEIAAISGHSIERTERILEVYLPRTRAMASAAIAKLDEYRK